MVAAIHRIAHSMELETIAEWVESEAVLDELCAIGVDYAQGWCLGTGHPFVGG